MLDQPNDEAQSTEAGGAGGFADGKSNQDDEGTPSDLKRMKKLKQEK